MSRLRQLSLGVVAALLAVAAGGTAGAQAGAADAAAAPLDPAQVEAFVDGVVQPALLRDHIAGAAVAVVQDGRVILKKGYGFASLEPYRPVDPDRTLFRLGSTSKTFTWILVMREVEAGRMRLDKPIDFYLPASLRPGTARFGPVRVEDLMDHSGGFDDRRAGHQFEGDARQVRPLATYLAEEKPRRVRPPGTVTSYSNYGAALAGAAVAHVRGALFEDLAEAEIFRPLGMTRTTFREARPAAPGLPAPMPAELARDVSRGFRWTSTGYQPKGFEYLGQIAPAGGGSSTAADMAAYMLALLGGGRLGDAAIYGPTAAQAFRTPVRPTPPGAVRWLHGVYETELPGGLKGFGHGGGTLFFSSDLLLVPERRLGIFVIANTEGAGSLSYRLAGMVVQRFYGPPPAPPRRGDPRHATALRAFQGEYLSSRRAASGLEAFMTRLGGVTRVQATDGGMLMVGGTGPARAYVPDGDPSKGRFLPLVGLGGMVSGYAPLVFEMQDGRPARILTGTAAFEPIGPLDSPRSLRLAAGLTLAAAAATLAGLFWRRRSELQQTRVQAWASRTQTVQALVWLGAVISLMAFASTAQADTATYGWPPPGLVAASAFALAGALLTLVSLALAPAAIAGKEWRRRRKAAYLTTAAVYAVFSLLLLRWHALAPWAT